jgi:hypothetical protein
MGSRLFGYNSGATVSGTIQSGNLAVSNDFRAGGSVQWWNGPNEDLGYVIGYPDTSGNRKANGSLIGGNAVGFRRTSSKTDSEFLLLANSLTGQRFLTASVATDWLNTNGFYTSYPQYLFDTFATYGATPRAAFSFRLLNSSYFGPCCRIRRGSDSQEIDINFVNGVVDTTSIQSFSSGSIAYIVYIYDQSGNGRHRSQTIAIRQPHIMSASNVIYTQNSRVAVNLNDNSHMLQHSASASAIILPGNANYSAFNVYRNTQPNQSLLFTAGTNQYAFVADSGGAGSSAFGQASSTLNKVNNLSVTMTDRDECYTALADKPSIIAHYSDFNLQSTWGGNFWFGGYNVVQGGFAWLGFYMEEIYCDGLQVSNSALSDAVYANQKNYYNL